jgi:hypothetical protein
VDLQQRFALDARRLCTLTKLELRKLRAGGEIMASG